MTLAGWNHLLANFGLAAALVIGWAQLLERSQRLSTQAQAVILGVAMTICIQVTMRLAVEMAPGLIFDLRSPLLALAGLFGGAPAALIAMVPTLVYRAQIGGVGAWAGCLAIVGAAAAGFVSHRLRRGGAVGIRDLTNLALVVTLTGLLSMFALPAELRVAVLLNAALPLLSLSFVSIIVLGLVFVQMRRRAELAQENALYRALVETLPECLNVKDTNGRFLLANMATARFHRATSPRDLIGKTDHDFFPPEVADRFRDDERAFLAEGRSLTIDQAVQLPDGQAGWVSTLKAPFHDADGALIGIITHNRDITEHKRLALELAETSRWLETVIATAPDAIVTADATGRIRAFNRAAEQIFGYNAERVIGHDLSILMPQPDASLHARFVATAGESDTPRVLGLGRQLEGKRADGSTFPLEISLSRTTSRGERLFVGVLRDVTERKAHEMALDAAREAAARTKSEFLATMSHEIRTPMTAILGMADLLAVEALPPQAGRHVAAIRASGRQLLSVINEVLDISRIETTGLELERTDFTLATIAEMIRSMLHPQAQERGLRLDIELPVEPLPALRGDPNRLRQVLINLVGNAIKFTKQGRVALTVARLKAPRGRVPLRFEVRDTGIGIPPEQREILFQPFAQGDASVLRRFGGSGLGLAISKRIVEAMDGRIGVESVVGVGSCFWFEVELDEGDAASATAVEATEGSVDAEGNLPPLRILVAEDAPLNRDLIGHVLRRQGHQLVIVEDGAQAVAAVNERDPFDLILLDIQMPVMGGEEAARRIRKLDAPLGDTPIVAFTANVMAGDRERYLAAGMNGWVMKPISWPALTAAMARCVQGRKLIMAAPDGEAAPLIDETILAQIGDGFSPEETRAFMARALADAETARDLLQTAVANQNVSAAATVAHRLSGTSAMFALSAVAEAARAIECAAQDDAWRLLELVEELARIIAITRTALDTRTTGATVVAA